jgi:hypothetical protein
MLIETISQRTRELIVGVQTLQRARLVEVDGKSGDAHEWARALEGRAVQRAMYGAGALNERGTTSRLAPLVGRWDQVSEPPAVAIGKVCRVASSSLASSRTGDVPSLF